MHRVLVGKPEERDPGVDGRIILRQIFRKWEWMKLAQDREMWRALVSRVMNFRVP